jgi:dihydrolipoamide dehydrogenase
MGSRVTLVEKSELGGTCLNRGCIPSKALLEAASRYTDLKEAAQFGLRAGDIGFDYRKVGDRKNQVVSQLRNGVEGLIRGNGINSVRGKGTISRGGVRVEKADGTIERINASRGVLIATGSKEGRPPIPGVNLPGVIGSDQALELDSVPNSIVIVGGGPVGVEFATIFNSFGSRVTVVEMLPTLLPLEDAEMGGLLARSFARKGITIKTGTAVRRIESDQAGLAVIVGDSDGQTEDRLSAERVLIAVGRQPNTDGLGVAESRINMRGRHIQVDESMRTSAPAVYAAGDVVGGYMLAHVGSAEGEVAVEHMLGHQVSVDYRSVPSCTYSSPQVAGVGLTEAAAREAGHQVKIGHFPFAAASKGIVSAETEGVVKIIAESEYNQVLGVHIIARHATDMIAEAALAINLETTLDDFANTIHPHPTMTEAVREASLDADSRVIHMLKRRG